MSFEELWDICRAGRVASSVYESIVNGLESEGRTVRCAVVARRLWRGAEATMAIAHRSFHTTHSFVCHVLKLWIS